MPLPVELPISKYFGPERCKEVHQHALDRIESLVRGLREVREEKVQKWRKIYYGIPREKTKSFPWQGASNLVVQLVGSYVDQLTAVLVMGILGIEPFWVASLAGQFETSEHAEDQRLAVEDWLCYSGLEPSLMGLMPKYEIWGRTTAKYGMAAMKLMPERTVEQVFTGGKGFEQRVKHDGPVALPLLFEDFLIPPTTIELERAPIVCQRAKLSKFDLELLKHDSTYNKEALVEVLKQPDRYGPDPNQQDIEQVTGARTDVGSDHTQEWDIYEAYFPFNAGGKVFQIIGTFHLQTRQCLKCVFNWLPENSLPFVIARLGSDGERSHGLGFCEMLKDYQEEVSAIHNRRGDASTLSNTNVFRVDFGSQMDSQVSIFPNAIIPGVKDSFEVIPMGRTANETIKDETMTLQLAQDRAGIGPASSGQGAGTVNKKGGYSAMGTFAVMQQGDTRKNLNVTSFRQSHYMLGRLKLLYDSHFGIDPKRIKALRQQGQYLQQALDNYREGRIILPIRAATGSVNKEIEKQNLMLLLNNVRAHWQQVAQLLQATQNPMMPPESQAYMMEVIISSNLLMRRIVREFGFNDPSQLLPEPKGIQEKTTQIEKALEQQKQMQQQNGQVAQGGGVAPPPSTSGEMHQVQAPGAPSMPPGVQ